MTVNRCDPCSDPCMRGSAGYSEAGWLQQIANILCASSAVASPAESNLISFSGTYNGTDQEVVPAQGAGKVIKVRSMIVGTDVSSTDWQLGSKVGAAATVPKTPNFDYLSNAGLVANDNPIGWLRTDANGALVITTSGPIDLFGTAEVVG